MAECVIIVNRKIRTFSILLETCDCGDFRELEARRVVNNGMAIRHLMRLSTRRGPRPFDELFLDRRVLIISSDALLVILLKRLNPVYRHPPGFFFRIQNGNIRIRAQFCCQEAVTNDHRT